MEKPSAPFTSKNVRGSDVMDIRRILAEEIGGQIGAIVLEERCPKCRGWYIEKPGQDIPLCWGCITDRNAAQRAYTTLTKAKLAAKGIIVEDHGLREWIAPKEITSDDEDSSWPEGMIL